MKTLFIAIAIGLVGIIVVFIVLSLVGLDKSVAGPIATAIVGGIPYVRESLDKQGLPFAHRKTSYAVPSFDGFGLPPQRLILEGSLILFAVMQLSAGLGGLIGAASGLVFATSRPIIYGFVFIVVYPTVYLIGRWVGRRSVTKGLVTIFLIGAVARVVASLLDLIILSSQDIALLVGMAIWKQIAFGTALFFLIGSWGYWRGRRQRLAAYLAYLLGCVSIDTREAIVGLAYTEACRTTNPALAST